MVEDILQSISKCDESYCLNLLKREVTQMKKHQSPLITKHTESTFTAEQSLESETNSQNSRKVLRKHWNEN